ncbi:hypothetical protein [Candidatus Nitrosotenuis chungbukensis]|uniref:hypothetical protein n=1 Tax=Candidatus Nitrosotenuis chungbukensis TaxID=1353246 RepID=UPI002A4E1FB7|nr:hypothetical protein [Candidatus Nitrosotenuis chungbukensis]
MEEEPKDVIVLGAIKKGAKKFDKIKNKTGIEPEEAKQDFREARRARHDQSRQEKGAFWRRKNRASNHRQGLKRAGPKNTRDETKLGSNGSVVQIRRQEKAGRIHGVHQVNASNDDVLWDNGHDDVFNDVFNDGLSNARLCSAGSGSPGAENQPSDVGDGGADAGGDMGGDGGGGFDIDIGF